MPVFNYGLVFSTTRMFVTYTFWVQLLAVCNIVHSANILCVFNLPSKSHQFMFQVLWKELSLRGHKVTVITTDPLNDPALTNLTEIDVSYSYALYRNLTIGRFSGTLDHWKVSRLLYSTMIPVNEVQFSHPQIRALLEDNTVTFDVILTEPIVPFGVAFRLVNNCSS